MDTPSQRYYEKNVGTPEHTERNQRSSFRYNLKKLYGITEDDYNDMLAAQNGGCAICGGQEVSGRRLAVDHCHTTGKVRALLCSGCNRGIGLLGEDTSRMRLAIAYLERHKAQE